MRASVQELLVHWKEREAPHALIGGQLKKESAAEDMALASMSGGERGILPVMVKGSLNSSNYLYYTERSCPPARHLLYKFTFFAEVAWTKVGQMIAYACQSRRNQQENNFKGTPPSVSVS